MLTLLCGCYGNIEVTSSWVIVQSIMLFTYGIGFGFATTTRNYVGKALGKGQKTIAKKIAGQCTTCTFFVGLLWATLLVVFSKKITHLFTQVEAGFEMQQNFIILYGLTAFYDIMWSTLSNLLRLTNKIWLLNVNSVINMDIMMILIASLGLWTFDLGGCAI